MRRLAVLLALSVVAPSPGFAQTTPDDETRGKIYYVRQSVGSDLGDGLTPETAWSGISELGTTMQAGDTVYVGPGLYRENVALRNDGTAEARITFIADPTGEHTGDRPGIVMIAGSDAVDETLFEAIDMPDVYKASVPDAHVLGVVEMDGDQYRYLKTRETREHVREGMTHLEVVSKLPSSYYYDQDSRTVYIHTSDGKPPEQHEIELIHRGSGFSMYDRHYITIVGFTIRNVGDGGIVFFTGSSNGVALGNTSYGSRQGIRVYGAVNVLVAGNTLFRNENCGVYFAKESTDGMAIDNILYENVKGVRWSSDSIRGLAVGNVAFDNDERGISVENTEGVRLARNRLVNNATSQILATKSRIVSEDNCFENGAPEQLTAELDYFRKYATLEAYRAAEHLDLASRQGGCGKLPAKIDVRKLHAKALAYEKRSSN